MQTDSRARSVARRQWRATERGPAPLNSRRDRPDDCSRPLLEGVLNDPRQRHGWVSWTGGQDKVHRSLDVSPREPFVTNRTFCSRPVPALEDF